jgi:hypothetical protein
VQSRLIDSWDCEKQSREHLNSSLDKFDLDNLYYIRVGIQDFCLIAKAVAVCQYEGGCWFGRQYRCGVLDVSLSRSASFCVVMPPRRLMSKLWNLLYFGLFTASS